MDKEHTPFISVFIPTYNDEEDLSDCLESIRCLKYPKEKIEIIIWDNASTDSTVSMVRNCFNEMNNEGWRSLILVEWHSNEGSYIPYNLVLPRLNYKTEYILGLDADIELADNTLSILVDTAEDNNAAVVGARSVYFENPTITSHGAGFVSNWTALYTDKDSVSQIECDYVIGCCWLINRRVFEAIGCFDPQFYISHWEIDFCIRIKQSEHRIIYNPAAIIKHKIPQLGVPTPQRTYYLYRNKVLLIKNNPIFFKPLLTVFLYVGLSFCKLPYLLYKSGNLSSFKAAIIGLADGLLSRYGPKSKETITAVSL